jgi:hypothetical protein
MQQQEGKGLIYIQFTISVRRLSRAGVREPAKRTNRSAFRRSAQPLGTLLVDPKSNRYIPRNLLTPRIMVRRASEPSRLFMMVACLHYIYFFILAYQDFNTLNLRRVQNTTTQTTTHLYGTREELPVPQLGFSP